MAVNSCYLLLAEELNLWVSDSYLQDKLSVLIADTCSSVPEKVVMDNVALAIY